MSRLSVHHHLCFLVLPGEMSEAEDLPKANVKRIVGAKLTEFQEQFAAEDKKGRAVQINKDALEAFVQSAKIFIHYLSAT